MQAIPGDGGATINQSGPSRELRLARGGGAPHIVGRTLRPARGGDDGDEDVTHFRRTRFAALAAALMLSASGFIARADEAKLPPMPRPLEELATTKVVVPPEQASMEAWGRAHPDCVEWTDNCQVCVAGDKPGCSTVGTACVRTAPACRKTRSAAQPEAVPTPVPRPTQPDAPAQPGPAPAKP